MKRLEEFVQAADGSKLATSIFLPGEGKYPVLLAMTPYGREQLAQVAQLMCSRGFAMVIQDVRGRYDSTGTFEPVRQEREDAPLTVEWVEKQPWYDRDKGVGIIGISYLSLVGFLAGAKNQAVKTMFNAGGMADSYSLVHRGGAVMLHHSLPWSIIVGHSKTQPDLKKADWPVVFRTSPIDKADEAAGYPSQMWKEIIRRPIRDESWEGLSVWTELREIEIPILHYTGWYDICLGSALELFSFFQEKSSRKQQLFIGPWGHGGILQDSSGLAGVDFGPESKSDLFSRGLEWFSCYLKGEGKTENPEGKAVNLFITGKNQWQSFDRWPPEKARPAEIFLGQGSLNFQEESEPGNESFIFNPADPTPTLGGTVWEFPAAGLEPGPWDQSPLSRRKDVISFSTETLEEDLTIAGPAECRIFGSVEGESGDWVARVVDISPDGKRRWVADGILRSHFRDGPRKVVTMIPGRVESFKIDLWAMGHTFKKGHRLGLEISGSSFPKWDLNLTGLDRNGNRKQTVFWGGEHPSWIKVYVL